MTASTCPEGYQSVTIDDEQIEALVSFLRNYTEGPAEAMALLHAGIVAIDNINGEVRSAAQLGRELTMDLLCGGYRDS